ncbi:MAG: hypothetical protein HY275_03560 [Gemmatimonadetes bacterium]|nr:hypothetical protein [Gemmatimonadota bacterium]
MKRLPPLEFDAWGDELDPPDEGAQYATTPPAPRGPRFGRPGYRSAP